MARVNKWWKIFLAIYPLFSLTFFYNSFFTLVQIGILGMFLIGLFIKKKETRKHISLLVIYYIIIAVYALFHHLNALDFKSLVPGDFNYNSLTEVLALFKVSMPVVIVYLVYQIKLERKDYGDIFKWWIILIAGSIVVTNILGISLGSYTGTTIKASIWKWFNSDYLCKDLASVGFFMFANQISCWLVVLVPLVFDYYMNKEIKGSYFVILLLALLMLGTRVANLGGFLVLIGIIISYVIFKLFKKERVDFKRLRNLSLLILVYGVILPFSPTFKRYQEYEYLLDAPRLVASLGEVNQSDLEYIKDNYEYKQINENFIINSYPYQYDPKFWLDILELPLKDRADYRYLEIAMVKRVMQINDNFGDVFLGITNTRIQNIFNIERDYVLQYYAYGVIGLVLFLGGYFWLFGKNVIKFIKEFRFSLGVSVSCCILILFIAYFSGNIFSQIAIFAPLVVIMAHNLPKKID